MGYIEELFDLFESRTDVYAQCWLPRGEKRYAYKSIKETYNTEILEKHLTEPRNKGIGVYPLLKEDECKWVAADFDIHDDEEKKEVADALEKIRTVASGVDLPIYTEISKSGKGLHIWIFFSEVVQSWKARKLMMALITAAGAGNLSSMDRLFPSQDRLHQNTKGFGNLIHMPFSAHFCPDYTVFFDADGTKYTNDPDDIEMWLGTVIQVTPTQLDVMLDQWGLAKEVDKKSEIAQDTVSYQYADDGLQQVLQDPFISWCRENPSLVDYDAWLGLITNLLPYGEDGIKAIHSISAMDTSRYDKAATDRKIIECQGMKPITYKWLTENTKFDIDENLSYKSPAAAGVKTGVQSPVYEWQGGYWYRLSEKKSKQLSNFTLTPVSYVEIDGVTERIYDIHTPTTIVKDMTIPAEILADGGKFRAYMLSNARDASFYGDSSTLIRIKDYITESYPNMPTIEGQPAVGLYMTDHIGTWAVLTQKRAWSRFGEVDNLMYYNNSTTKRLVHTHEAKLTVKDLERIKPALFMFNKMSISGVVVGWMAINMVSPRLREIGGLRMPCMIIHGQAGCGKTEMTRAVMQKFFGDLEPSTHVGDTTRFIYALNNASSNMFPMFYDEYKPSQWAHSQKKLVSEAVRGTYDGNVTKRGRANLTSVEYRQIAPAVYIGEEGFTETALVERSVECFMSKEESFQYTDGFLAMKSLPMIEFGNTYLNWTLTVTDNELLEIWERVKLPNKNADRPVHNTSMLLMGLELMAMFFSDQGIKLIVDPVKKAVIEAQDVYTNEYGSGTRSAVDYVLEALMTMMDAKLLTGYEMKYSSSDEYIFLNVREAYPKFKKWARETEYSNEMITEAEFNKQIRKMDYFVDYRTARMGTSDGVTVAKKVRVLSVEKMREAGLIENEDSEILD